MYEHRITHNAFCQLIFDKNVYLLPANKDGKPLYKDTPKGRITNVISLQKWQGRGYTRFIFRPCTGNLIVIDLDRHPEQGDGVKAFQALTGINPFTHPYYVQTPGNGVHLYFQADGRDYVSCPILSGCEVKYKAFVTIAGSLSDKGQYIPVGNFSEIPPIPGVLKKLLKVKPAERTQEPRKYFSDSSIDELAATVARTDGLCFQPGARNMTAFSLAKYARKRGKDQNDVISWIVQNFSSQDFTHREIQAAVRSAYNWR